MDRLSNADWWWDTAFDGAGSTAVATIIGLVGVVLALRHDRRLAAKALLDSRAAERESAFLSELAGLLSRTHEVTLRVMQTQNDPAALHQLAEPWRVSFVWAARLAPSGELQLMMYLDYCISRCLVGPELFDFGRVALTAVHVHDTLELRLRDPEYFRDLSPDFWARLRAAANSDEPEPFPGWPSRASS